MLIDSHCHLDDVKLKDDLDGVIARAKEAGVSHILSIAAQQKEINDVISIVDRYSNVFAALGEHPYTATPDFSAQSIEAHLSHPKVIGIGECGFDFSHVDNPSYEIQKKCFEDQIELALKYDLPLIIHTREADQQTSEILKYWVPQGLRGVLHCYTSGMDLAKLGLDLGFYLSASGVVTFKNAEAVRDVFRMVPLDQLLVETDGPYLAPEPNRGKVCEPAYTADTARRLALIKNVSFELFAKETTANFLELFNKVKLD